MKEKLQNSKFLNFIVISCFALPQSCVFSVYFIISEAFSTVAVYLFFIFIYLFIYLFIFIFFLWGGGGGGGGGGIKSHRLRIAHAHLMIFLIFLENRVLISKLP